MNPREVHAVVVVVTREAEVEIETIPEAEVIEDLAAAVIEDLAAAVEAEEEDSNSSTVVVTGAVSKLGTAPVFLFHRVCY